MDTLVLKKPATTHDWLEIFRLYRSAFPREERKPFFFIQYMFRKGRADVWYFADAETFCGFATTVNSESCILLDYLAIVPSRRGLGFGSCAMKKLLEQYAGKGVLVEIESTGDPGPDQALRLRRKRFYEQAGMISLGVTAWVFGVKMELMGSNCRMDFDGYKAFYRNYNSPWAAEHILPPE